MLSTNDTEEIQNINTTELVQPTRREENYKISKYGVALLINMLYKLRVVLDGSVYHALIELVQVDGCNTFPVTSTCIGFLIGANLPVPENDGEENGNWEGCQPRSVLRITGLVPVKRRLGGLLRGRTETDVTNETIPCNSVGLFSTYIRGMIIF